MRIMHTKESLAIFERNCELKKQLDVAKAFIKRQQDALKTTLPWLTPCAVMAEVEKCIWIADEFADETSGRSAYNSKAQEGVSLS